MRFKKNQQISYKYRIYPTDGQKQLFAKTFGCVRYIYNNMLEYRHNEYHQNKNSVGYSQTSVKFTQMRKEIEWFGRTFHRIDKWYPSSKTCSSCGHLHDSMPLNKKQFSCENCGTQHDRDINAAINILTVGHTELACGIRGKTKAQKSNALDNETRIPSSNGWNLP